MKQHDPLLARVVAETLEQFAFLFGEPEEDARASDGEDYYEAAIGFAGAEQTRVLHIAAPATLCREMAGNFLGLEGDEIPPDAPEDAIKELANVLVGSYTAARLGVDVCCKLETPVAGKVGADRINELAALDGAQSFRVDEHLFVAVLMPPTPGRRG